MSTASPTAVAAPAAPLTSAQEGKARMREARRNFLLCALFFSLSLPLQPVVFGRWDVALVLAQVVWSACFVLLGLVVGAGWIGERMAGSVAGLVSLANLTWTVHLTGGVASSYFPFFHTIPLVIAIFSPRQRLPVQVAIGATLGCMLLVLALGGAPPRTSRCDLSQAARKGRLGSSACSSRSATPRAASPSNSSSTGANLPPTSTNIAFTFAVEIHTDSRACASLSSTTSR